MEKINVKLLSTSIMLVFGVDGHGNCATQSVIACEVLKKMGYNAKVVGGYHAMMHRGINNYTLICHAPTDIVPFVVDDIKITYDNHQNKRKWYHCWVETGDKIIDVNLHKISIKKYTNISKWNQKNLIKGKHYYMPTDYDFNEEVTERKVNQVIKTYNELDIQYPQALQTEEGPIIVRDDGSWIPMPGYKFKDTIKPHTVAFATNPNILEDMERLLGKYA